MNKKNILAFGLSCLLGSVSFQAFAADESESFKQGKKIYTLQCAACHQATGQGVPGAFPPLAGSDYLLEDKQRAINVPLKGLTGKVTVNGQDYNSAMPSFAHLKDEEIAAVMTYVMQAWGNEGPEVTAEEVAQSR
jgi:mono/diheme cytochrome c family protein